MFKELKDRFAEKIKNLGPQDDLDRAITAMVERGTAESVTAPDWTLCMELVDLVNKYPGLAPDKFLRIINRTIAKPVVPTQLLALTMLDTCVRNCHPILHHQLSASVLWADLLKLVQDTSLTRVDSEVRDRILIMIEDYGRFLNEPPAFAAAYGSLVDQGMDFPVRNPHEIVPIDVYVPEEPWPQDPTLATPDAQAAQPTVPATAAGPATVGAAPTAAPLHTTAAATAKQLLGQVGSLFSQLGSGGEAGRQAAATAPRAAPEQPVHVRGIGWGQRLDPSVLEGLSEEDRAAVQAAMAEMALESGQGQAGGEEDFSALANLPVEPPPARVPELPEKDDEALQVISGSVSLFSEMVSGIPDSEPEGVRDQVIRDLAEQCTAYKSRLARMASEASDETVLVSALELNDSLGGVMARYDALVAQALSSTTAAAPTEMDTAARAAAATSAISAPVAPSAGNNFTLLDEDEEEDAGAALVTSRTQPVNSDTRATGDLLDLLSAPTPDSAPGAAAATAKAAEAAKKQEDPLI